MSSSSEYAKVIAIDGPSGSGKSTIAKLVSKKLNLTYLDTGAMFRALALFLSESDITSDDDSNIAKSLARIDFQYAKSAQVLVEINDQDLTTRIREHSVSALASQYSKNQVVRSYLKDLQRSIAKVRPSILEGRDIGTIIFPNAALKFFLTADNAIRANRRYLQILENDPETDLTVDSILKDIEKRDEEDRSRAIAPLEKAKDAIEIDSTALSIDEVVQYICRQYEENKEKF